LIVFKLSGFQEKAPPDLSIILYFGNIIYTHNI